jgi:hypothetical protein
MTRAAPWGIALAAWLAACRSDDGASPFDIADPHALWLAGEFVQVVSPIRFPSPEADAEQVEVWLAIDAGASVGAAARGDGSPSLRFGAGTRADRLEWNGSGDDRRIVDVRGTWIDARGGCSHHVLRPVDETPGAPLVGMQWPCDDAAAATAGATRMRDRVAALPPFAAMPQTRRKAALDGFTRQLDCDGCHREERADASRVDEYGAVWRGTDATGFFAPAASLRDALPLEGYGAFDPNVDDPAIDVTCPSGEAGRVTKPSGAARWTCDDAGVPIGHFDWADADPSRRAAICDWRLWLRDRLDDSARAAFADAFAPCLGAAPQHARLGP